MIYISHGILKGVWEMNKKFIVFYEIPPLRAIMSIEVEAGSEEEAKKVAMQQLGIYARIKGTQVKS